jgi:hypothetical protein
MISPSPEPVENERLTDALKRLMIAADGHSMAVTEMVEVMQGRGLHMIILLLCLPFLSPVTIPGLSLPFGLAIVVCGFRIGFGHKPWLPGFIMRHQVSHKALERMVRVGLAVYARLEKIIRPRLEFVFNGAGMRMTTGLAIALAGLLLSLPIPPPFPLTNTIPGFAIVFFSLGLSERDGVMLLVGYGMTILATVYVALIALAGKAGVESLWHLFTAG